MDEESEPIFNRGRTGRADGRLPAPAGPPQLRLMRRPVLVALLALAACGETSTGPQGLSTPRFRAIAGVSMGAIGASQIGARHPELFDAIGALGGPLDPEYFLHYLEDHHLGGFCAVEELEAIAASAGDPLVLEDPENLPCMEAAPAHFEAVLPERRQRFDRWIFGRNGGTFDRDAYLDLFEDLVSAYGNPLYDVQGVLPPGLREEDLADPDFCASPRGLPPVPHPVRNPGGKYPSVTFCDGGTQRPFCAGSGRPVHRCREPDVEAACADEGGVEFATSRTHEALWAENAAALEPCAERTRPVPFALAVDVNGNGRRDYGEPVALAASFSPDSARQRLLDLDPARLLAAGGEAGRRMAFFVDAGIRDIFQFDIHAAQLFERLREGSPEARRFEGVRSFPGAPASEAEFRPLLLGPEALPPRMLYLYGDPAASAAEIEAGDGDHVGTPRQVLNRLLLFLRWISLRWSDLPDPPADSSSFFARARSLRYFSSALGAEREFAIVLPPGYDAPENRDVRYPVLFLLHGYGQKAVGPGGFWESFLVVDGWMASGQIRKMILVFPSGRCCQRHPDTGELRCLERAAEGFVPECRSGTFYARSVRTGRDYAGAVLDLVEFVDRQFRTLSADAHSVGGLEFTLPAQGSSLMGP